MKALGTNVFYSLFVRILPIAACVVAAGCRTTEDVLADYNAAISSGDYTSPISEVTGLAEKEDDSQQLWRLLSGSANYMADHKSEALRQFDAAELAFKKNDTTSVFAQAGNGALSMLTNDKTFPYDGGGQDRIFTCLYKAIDFMSLGKMDEARVELNRSCQYQSNWLYDRRRDIEAAEKRLDADAAAYQAEQKVENPVSKDVRSAQVSSVLSNPGFSAQIKSKCSFDPAVSGNLSQIAASDYMNAYAMHVTGVFRWLSGDSDRNYLRDAARIARNNPIIAQDYAEMENGASPDGWVWVWVEDGLCPVREEWRLDLPLGLLPYVNRYVIYAGMALPYLRARHAAASIWKVTAGGDTSAMSQVVDMDALLKTEYDVYMRGALSREISRAIVKVSTQVALGVAADTAAERARKKGESPVTSWALKAAQIGVAAWARATTYADLRSWSALPKSVKVVRVKRPADGRIRVWADSHYVDFSIFARNGMVFIRKPSLAAPFVVKVAEF